MPWAEVPAGCGCGASAAEAAEPRAWARQRLPAQAPGALPIEYLIHFLRDGLAFPLQHQFVSLFTATSLNAPTLSPGW